MSRSLPERGKAFSAEGTGNAKARRDAGKHKECKQFGLAEVWLKPKLEGPPIPN